MTKYLALIRGGDEGYSKLSPEEMQLQMEAWGKWMKGLNEKGHDGSGESLKASGKVLRDHGKLVTDGPYMEGKELVGGFILINAETEEEAIELSKDCPVFEMGGIIELREIGGA
jgi:hypothetical protein